jgi:hypothetical protein
MKGRWRGAVVATVAVAALSGCGGGGGGSPTPSPDTSQADAEKAVGILAFGIYDATSHFLRVAEVVGLEALTASPVSTAPITVACPGGGTAFVQRGSNILGVGATACRPSVSEPLTYNGGWTAAISLTGYAADGTCTANCTASFGALANGAATFGYGGAPDAAIGGGVQASQTGGTRNTFHFFTGTPIPGAGIRLNGSLNHTSGTPVTEAVASLNAADIGSNSTVLVFRGTRSRLVVTEPLSVTVTLAATGIVIAVDRDRNGTVDASYNVPWAELQ